MRAKTPLDDGPVERGPERGACRAPAEDAALREAAQAAAGAWRGRADRDGWSAGQLRAPSTVRSDGAAGGGGGTRSEVRSPPLADRAPAPAAELARSDAPRRPEGASGASAGPAICAPASENRRPEPAPVAQRDARGAGYDGTGQAVWPAVLAGRAPEPAPIRHEAPVLAAPEALAYHDVQSAILPVAVTAPQLWALMTARSGWLLRLAFRIRDGVSAPFGIDRIGGFADDRPRVIRPGGRLDFFTVATVAPDLLVLMVRDRHLDVMTCLTTEGRAVAITSSVVTHNWFGRLYMLPVRPAHRWIVRSKLRAVRRALRCNPTPPEITVEPALGVA